MASPAVRLIQVYVAINEKLVAVQVLILLIVEAGPMNLQERGPVEHPKSSFSLAAVEFTGEGCDRCNGEREGVIFND